MKTEKLLAVLRLQATQNVGDIIAKKLINVTGSVEQIFKESRKSLAAISGIGSFTIQNLLDEKNLKGAEDELQYLQQNNISFSYFLDEDYPENLKHCIDAPILFFKEGNINLNNPKTISIVGTRNMTSYGRDFCNELIEELQPHQPIIISGFAYGVDICAHKAAMKNDLQTLAVLAHGLEEVYPKTHKQYIHEIHKNGGFITEFWHDEKPQRENFLKRNRIVAGLSKATIIIESASKGGSLVTADIANSYHRDVFALPGKTTDVYSQGCNNLIKNNQAHLLNSAQDIISMLNWDIPKTSTPKQVELFVQLTDTEQKVYDHLQKNNKQHIDTIALACEIPIYQLSSILLQMELKGVIKPLPGKLFEV
ncbi:DNA-processing protein DprA [uncultured Tenacibaculum sp.]|uniref:DNA-processing protein DprA n=1 Tax=uncultured Tenacibaculum sp. TaxID=174713 RepID=UPI00262640E8|nr:DNA-processing protein DprA [uncultured Tenacibaculum sp.]